MDEPTAALDSLSEAKPYEQVGEFSKTKSTVFITHRMSSAKTSDHIAFFKDGTVQEYGTFSELMELRGAFYEFYCLQAKYYQKEKTKTVQKS